MFSRLSYTFRETWASFRRNMTLTVAAIITSAVSLLIFGLTLLMQRGFDNLLVAVGGRRGDDRLRQPGRHRRPAGRDRERPRLAAPADRDVHLLRHRRARSTRPQRLLAGDPATLRAADRRQHPDAVQGRADRRHRRRHAAPAARQPARAAQRVEHRARRGAARRHLQAQGLRRPVHRDPVDRPAVRRRSC